MYKGGYMLPYKLKKGDTIGVVSSSEPITEDRIIDIESSTKFFEGLGLKIKLGKYLKSNELGYGTTAKNKAEDFNEMFKDKEVKAIFCACGGYNVNAIFDYLDYEEIKKNPKIICGYSDPTSLINAIYSQTGLVTFHGPNFGSLADTEEGVEKYTRQEVIKRFIEGNLQLGNNENEYKTIKEGQAEGVLVGGNLSLISHLVAGKYKLDFTDKILFIEELAYDSPAGMASNYLYYMKQNGVFDKIKGIWIGAYESEISLEKIVLDTIGDEYNFPIIKSNNFGHIPKKTVIPIGVKAKIDTCEKEKIKLLENCVQEYGGSFCCENGKCNTFLFP